MQHFSILSVGSSSNGKTDRSTPEFLKHLGNLSPGSATRVLKMPMPEKDLKQERLRLFIYITVFDL